MSRLFLPLTKLFLIVFVYLSHTSGVNGTPKSIPALSRKNSPLSVCDFNVHGGKITRHIEAVEVGDDGKPLKVIMDQTIEHSGPTMQNFTGYHETGTFKLGNDVLYSYQASSGPNGVTQVSVNWGRGVQGAAHGEFTAQDQVIGGNIDGRPFAPFQNGTNPASVAFIDGGLSPILSPCQGTNLNVTVQRLKTRISNALIACNFDTPSNITTRMEPRALDRFQDLGHHTDTYAATRCHNCKLAVISAGALAGVGCGVVCAATLGIGCGGCIAGAVAAVEIGIVACEASNLCCPNVCGDAFPPSCCSGSETCLNGNGLCCSAGQPPCAGLACCRTGQSCISQGTQKGTCCPDTAICANKCCPGDTDVCLNGNKCCPATKVCGTACCAFGIPNEIMVLSCANPQRNLCCVNGQVDVNGICCLPGQINCNGQCCGGSCTGPGGSCVETSASCVARGGTGQLCSAASPCHCSGGGCLCMSGCCVQSPIIN